jgi:hypothetical protein
VFTKYLLLVSILSRIDILMQSLTEKKLCELATVDMSIETWFRSKVTNVSEVNATRHHNSEDLDLNFHLHETLKSRIDRWHWFVVLLLRVCQLYGFFFIVYRSVIGLDDRGSGVRFPAGAGNFSLHHRVQNGSGAHPASYAMGTRGYFLGGKVAGAWSWPLTPI